MLQLYTMSFLFLFFLGYGEPLPVRGYKTAPAEAIGLPFDASRLSPWAADQASRIRAHTVIPANMPMPKASDYSSRIQLVASSASNEELQRENQDLRRRIEMLEQMMKNTLSQPPVSGAQSEEAGIDKKSVPGWTVELHDWNSLGTLADDPQKTLLTQNCAFTGNFTLEHKSQMRLYRYVATFRATQSGRYVFSSDLVCAFGHQCQFNLYVDEQPLIEFNGRTDGQRLVNGLPLTAGDHTIEFRTWLNSNNFIKYEPGRRYKWHVQVKGPSDFNARDFAPDELFSVIPSKVNMGARACTVE